MHQRHRATLAAIAARLALHTPAPGRPGRMNDSSMPAVRTLRVKARESARAHGPRPTAPPHPS
jgi:hypothetical protein